MGKAFPSPFASLSGLTVSGRIEGLLIAALLLAAGPVGAKEELPRYSLVVAVAESSTAGSNSAPCSNDAICIDTISFGAFAKARTLAGREVPESFGAQFVTHSRMQGQPLILLLEHYADGQIVAIDWRRGPMTGGTACLGNASFRSIDWQPEDTSFHRIGDQICGEVPAGGLPFSPEPIGVVDNPVVLSESRESWKPRVVRPDDDWGDVYLVLLDVGRGKTDRDRVYYPTGCDEPEVICLGGSIIVHRIEGSEVIAASTDKRFGTMPRVIHKPGPHAARGADGGRLVALAERTESGYWWVPWSSKVDNNKACVSKSVIEQFDISLGARSVDETDDEVCFRV